MIPIGVVIRTRNSAQYLSESLQSVLDQSPPPTAVVVVDGASSDATLDILALFKDRVRVIAQQHQGLAGAAQDGVDALDTPLIAFQDSDDIWPAGRLATMAEFLIARPELDGVMGRVEHFISPDLNDEQAALFDVPSGPQPGAGLPSLLVRRRAFEKAGPFLDGLTAGEYMEWHDRAVSAGVQIQAVDNLALYRRVHLNNFSRSPSSKQAYIKALRAVLQRKQNR